MRSAASRRRQKERKRKKREEKIKQEVAQVQCVYESTVRELQA